jgi:hypothetical protein
MSASTVGHAPGARAYRARLHSLQQLLFEARIARPCPRDPRPGRGSVERLEAVIATDEIRRTITRYVEVRSAVLARKSIDSLINDLLPFGEFLAGHHPEIVSLRQLERGHIEAFLVYNRTRTWRGRKTRDKQVAAYGRARRGALAAQLPRRHHPVGLGGAPTTPAAVRHRRAPLPRPLPRALAPNDDSALMAAVAELDDPFARCGCSCCATPGCGSVSSSTSNSTPSSTTARPAPGCGSRSAS